MILGLTGLLAPPGTAAARDERPCKTVAEQLKAQLGALRQATEAVLRKSSEMTVDDIPDFEQDFSGIGAQFKALMNARGEVLALYRQALGGDCGGDLSARLGSVNETVTAYNAWRAGQDAALEEARASSDTDLARRLEARPRAAARHPGDSSIPPERSKHTWSSMSDPASSASGTCTS